MTRIRVGAMAAVTLALVPWVPRASTGPVAAPAAAVTFAETIAPIVYANCARCHRPGEAAPFSLLTYDDVAKRAKLIAEVTQARVMPPWQAAHGHGEFQDERRLTDEQIAAIGEWVKAGTPRGDMKKLPKPPQFTDGWQLGKPDLVLEMPLEFEVPAEGRDIYRNFAVPTGLTEDKWVRAIEYRPSARSVVHHAIFQYIRGGAVPNQVGKDGKPGFGGAMLAALVPGFAPAGELGSWAVGGTPRALPDGLARPIAKGSDVVLQLHFHPTGKAEKEKSSLGLYFADKAPERKLRTPGVPGLFGLLANIDIPPGEKNYTITGRLPINADMKVVSISAHAHYLGKEIKATATLPDGSTKPMLWIPDWNFNWQDQYYYKEPMLLPKGSRMDVSISYDNSADNPRNPCKPPRRVQWGMQSYDEMGGVRLEMVAVNAEDEARVQAEGGGALRAGLQAAAKSDFAKRYIEQQKRFAAEGDGTGAGCSAEPVGGPPMFDPARLPLR